MLADLLQSGKILLADGATGTSLFAMGLAAGEAPEVWNLEHPERVRALHRGFVEAGSDRTAHARSIVSPRNMHAQWPTQQVVQSS